MTEGPFTLVGVREGDVCVGTALYDNRIAGEVEDLATVVLIFDTGAYAELHGLERAGGADWVCVLARARSENSLGAGFGSLVGEDYAEGGVDCGFGPRGGESARASQGGEEER